jgi:hypothetical protein
MTKKGKTPCHCKATIRKQIQSNKDSKKAESNGREVSSSSKHAAMDNPFTFPKKRHES